MDRAKGVNDGHGLDRHGLGPDVRHITLSVVEDGADPGREDGRIRGTAQDYTSKDCPYFA
jgi:hypothetical protein